jgi:mannose-6-phosphate isomerase-like protein (cupin superfamily)
MYADQAQNAKIDGLTNRDIVPINWPVHSREDLVALRARWKAMDGAPKLVALRAEGEDNSFLGFDVRTLLRGEESGGRHAVHSIILAPSAEIPAHGHETGEAIWFLMRGEIDITIGALTRTLKAPAFAYAPAQTTQAIANRSVVSAELYVVHSPAGVERAFAAARRLYLAQADADSVTYREIFADYGFIAASDVVLWNDARTNSIAARVDSVVETWEDFAALRAPQ